MGNLQVRGYKTVSKDKKDHFVGGTHKLWRIYPAVKEGTAQKASIFFFEASKYSNYKLSKENKTKILDVVRKEASNLARYMHGSVLKLYEPLYEKSDIVAHAHQAFVTEPVVCTLAEVLEAKNVERIANNDTNLKLILLEFLEGLQYLSDVLPAHQKNTLHLNLSPETIFVTDDGRLKIGGFCFVSQVKIEVSASNRRATSRIQTSSSSPATPATSRRTRCSRRWRSWRTSRGSSR